MKRKEYKRNKKNLPSCKLEHPLLEMEPTGLVKMKTVILIRRRRNIF